MRNDMENRFDELKKKALEEYESQVFKNLKISSEVPDSFVEMVKHIALSSFSVGFDYGYDNGNIEGLKDAEQN